MRPGTLQLAALPPLSLYVHLPWCLKKCPYCDFNSHEMQPAAMPRTRYLDALVADLEAALPLIWGRPSTASSSAAARPACSRRKASSACCRTCARA
jgi:coproporphyrinogen III oxidase-like Fe-S oxidoreductase